MCECIAILNKNDNRAWLWKEILQKDRLEIPLKHPLKNKANNGIFLEGDPNRLTTEEKNRMIIALAEKFSINEEIIRKDLTNGILPIKDENISIIICKSHVLAMM